MGLAGRLQSFEEWINESIDQMDTLIINSTVSDDLKGSAKLCLAKLYIANLSSDQPQKSAIDQAKSLSLLEDVRFNHPLSRDLCVATKELKGYRNIRLHLACEYARETHEDKLLRAHEIAHILFDELLADRNLDVDEQIQVVECLACIYIEGIFKPKNEKNIKTTVLCLYNQILENPDLDQVQWFDVKTAIIALYRDNSGRMDITGYEGRAKTICLYNELLESKKLTFVQKKYIERNLDYQKTLYG